MELFQERWRDRPFWMLVGCVLCNRTTAAKMEPILTELHGEFQMPLYVFGAKPYQVRDIIEELGLANVRTVHIQQLAETWTFHLSRHELDTMTGVEVRNLPGCGRYAADSWDIFVRRRRVRPQDKKLIEYVKEHRSELI